MEQYLQIRVSEASDVEARLEIRYTGAADGGAELVGTITGPRSGASRTLPATVRLRAIQHADLPAAAAVIPDPCFFTPELPYSYDVAVQLRRDNEIVDSSEFSLALYPRRVEKQ